MSEVWLVCGTRKKASQEFVSKVLDKLMWNQRAIYRDWKPDCIIEGCCKDSADIYAEKWAEQNDVKIVHHPGKSGGYLARNIEMVNKATLVIAFWDGYSYGTAHTIARATMRNIPVVVKLMK